MMVAPFIFDTDECCKSVITFGMENGYLARLNRCLFSAVIFSQAY
jgi:hypothetical protein